jgi:hypothetical protein
MAGYPNHVSLRNLPQKELAEILCERWVMNMAAKGLSVKTPRNKRRGPPSN